MDFKVLKTITLDRCPSVYMQYAAERTNGILSHAMLDKVQDMISSMALVGLATVTASRLLRECDEEARQKVASVFTKTFADKLGDVFKTTGETFLSMSAFLTRSKKGNSSSNTIRHSLMQV